MTPRERAEKIEQDHPHHIPQRHKLIEAITQAIKDALADEAAERALPGAPLSEERERAIRKRLGDRPAGRWLAIRALDISYDPGEPGVLARGTGASPAVCALILNAPEDMEALLADRQFLLGLIRDLGEDDPGKLAQWQSGRLFGINEGLEEAAKKIEEVCLAGAKDQLAAAIRALNRPTP